jgi:3-oxoacyl-[acyl-carrier protein] reductase
LAKRRAASSSSRHSSTRLRGQVALITGGNRGIGLAIARALAAEGCDIVITGRDRTSLRKAGRELRFRAGTRVLAEVCDVSQPQSVEALMAKANSEFGRLDILVNNAGISQAMAPVEKLDLDVWQKVITTNLTGMFVVTRATLPLLKRGAAIVNNLSVAAKRVFAGQAAYCASKHGGLGFTNTLREELRERGIRVIALMPGATDTAIWNQFWPDAPRKKMLAPETVAAALVDALLLPADSTVEEVTLAPIAGAL